MKNTDFVRLSRREMLKLSPLALAGVMGFKSIRTAIVESGLCFSDRVSGNAFRPGQPAEIFPDSRVVSFDEFPYNYYDVLDPEVDLDSWTLTVEGEVERPGEYTLDQIKELPHVSQNTRHICVAGWDAIGSFGGARISDFLEMVEVHPSARFIEVECADDYYSSIAIDDALESQSLLCYEMYGKPLNAGHGAPLRLQMPTKLGYKQAKYLVTFRVTNVLSSRLGYWENLGYSWHGGV